MCPVQSLYNTHGIRISTPPTTTFSNRPFVASFLRPFDSLSFESPLILRTGSCFRLLSWHLPPSSIHRSASQSFSFSPPASKLHSSCRNVLQARRALLRLQMHLLPTLRRPLLRLRPARPLCPGEDRLGRLCLCRSLGARRPRLSGFAALD